MLFFVLLMLFSLSIPCFVALSLRKRIECFLPLWISFCVVFLFAGGCVDLMPWSFRGLCALAIAGYLGVAIQSIRMRGVSFGILKQNVFTPGLFYFVTSSGLLYFFLRHHYFEGSDVFVHWGQAAYITFESGRLTCFSPQYLSHGNYMPGPTLLHYLLAKLNGDYSEGLCIFSQGFLISCCFSFLFGRIVWKRNLCFILFLGISLFCMPVLLSEWGYSMALIVDVILGVYFAFAVCFVLECRANRLLFFSGLSIILTFISLIKTSGKGLVVLLLFPVGVAWILELYRNRKALIGKKVFFDVIGFTAAVSCFVSATYAWGCLVEINKVKSKFSSNMDWSGLVDIVFFNSIDWFSQSRLMFFRKMFLNETVHLCGISLPLFSFIVICLILNIYMILKLKEKSPDLLVFAVMLPLESLLYAVTLFLIYFELFSEQEVLNLSSYERYISTFVIILMVFSIYCIIQVQRVNRRWALFASIGLLVLGVSSFNRYEFYHIVFNSEKMFPLRNKIELAAVLNKNRIQDQPDCKFLLSESDNRGLANYVGMYVFLSHGLGSCIPDIRASVFNRLNLLTYRAEPLVSEVYLYVSEVDDAYKAANSSIFEGGNDMIMPQRTYQYNHSGKFSLLPVREFTLDFEKAFLLESVFDRSRLYHDYHDYLSGESAMGVSIRPQGRHGLNFTQFKFSRQFQVKRISFMAKAVRVDAPLSVLLSGNPVARIPVKSGTWEKYTVDFPDNSSLSDVSFSIRNMGNKNLIVNIDDMFVVPVASEEH